MTPEQYAALIEHNIKVNEYLINTLKNKQIKTDFAQLTRLYRATCFCFGINLVALAWNFYTAFYR